MRRRRSKGNPLLFKIFGFVILLHIVALPILAKLGVFAKVEKQYTEATMVNLPPPEKVKPEAKKAEPHKAPQPKQVAHAPTSHAPSHPQNSSHENLPQPKLMAGSGGPSGGGDNGGFAVDPNGNGKAGQLAGASAPAPAPATPAPTPEAPAPTPAPALVARTSPAAPTPTPAPTPVPAPVFTEPEVVYAPVATLPDAVLTSLTGATDATAIVEIAVDTDGKPSGAQVIQSAGSGDLDQQALQIAAKYRFKPATRDGVPTEGAARVHIEFQVN